MPSSCVMDSDSTSRPTKLGFGSSALHAPSPSSSSSSDDGSWYEIVGGHRSGTNRSLQPPAGTSTADRERWRGSASSSSSSSESSRAALEPRRNKDMDVRRIAASRRRCPVRAEELRP